MTDDDALKDAKLIAALQRSGRAHPVDELAGMAGVEVAYAESALWRMTEGDTDYPIVRRPDLGPGVYEATEAAARGRRRWMKRE
jgi:hypothetical protein